MQRLCGILIGVVAMGMGLVTSARVLGDTTPPSAATRPAHQEPADVPAPKLGPDGQLDPHFKLLHEQFLLRGKQGPIGVLFLGDSITEGWSGNGKRVWDAYYSKLDAANFGISGDKTEHVLWRIENGELDGIHPKVVVLLIGTNNLRLPAENVLKGDEQVAMRIHEKLPDSKLLILGIFPRGATPTVNADIVMFRAKIKIINQGLAKLDDGKMTRFLDFGSDFLNPDGSLPKPIMHDYLHPSAAGYIIWADAMAPLLNDMLK